MSKWRAVLATLAVGLCIAPLGALYGCGPKDDTKELRPDQAKGQFKPRTEGARTQPAMPATD